MAFLTLLAPRLKPCAETARLSLMNKNDRSESVPLLRLRVPASQAARLPALLSLHPVAASPRVGISKPDIVPRRCSKATLEDG